MSNLSTINSAEFEALLPQSEGWSQLREKTLWFKRQLGEIMIHIDTSLDRKQETAPLGKNSIRVYVRKITGEPIQGRKMILIQRTNGWQARLAKQVEKIVCEFA